MKYVLVCRYLSTISHSQVSTQECIRSKSSSWYRLAVPSKSTKSTFRKSSSFVYSKPDDFIQCYKFVQVVNVVFYIIATILPNTIEKFISSLLHHYK